MLGLPRDGEGALAGPQRVDGAGQGRREETHGIDQLEKNIKMLSFIRRFHAIFFSHVPGIVQFSTS